MSPKSRKPTKILRERDVKAYCKKQVKVHGWEWRTVKWIGRKHAPDNLIMTPGMSVFPEFKRPKAKARAGQTREHDRMRKAGLFVVVLDTCFAVDDLMQRIAPRSFDGLIEVVGNGRQISEAIMEQEPKAADTTVMELIGDK